MNNKQVSREHYQFQSYMAKARWASVWHQLNEVIELGPGSVLEIGPGPGVFKRVGALFDLQVETLDLDPELGPDHVGSVHALPFASHSYDVVCAFQVLEHVPYALALDALAEMMRVARRNVVISLPDCEPVWRYQIKIPKFPLFDFLLKKPRLHGPRVHEFDGEHYWEVSARNYPLSRIVGDFTKLAVIERTYRVIDNPYHRFLF